MDKKSSTVGKSSSAGIKGQNPTPASSFVSTLEGEQDLCPDEVHKETALRESAIAAREYSLLKIRGLSDDEIDRFQDIKEQAAEATDAKAFLLSLSSDDRLLVKEANSYGRVLRDTEIQSMTEEGARNMLVTQDDRAYVDFNNDGIVDKGVGKMFVFPPPNAPDEVKDAWEKTINALPVGDRLMASSLFMLQSLQANVKSDAEGHPIGVYFPGEEGYTNIFPTRLEDWRGILDHADADLESLAAFDPTNPRLEKDLALMAAFRSNLFPD